MRCLPVLFVLACSDSDPAAAPAGPCLLVEEATDYDGDGDLETHLVHAYDARGRRVTTDSFDHTRDPSGVQESHSTYTYDAGDRLIRSEGDNNFDGTVDVAATYAYSIDARLILVAITHSDELVWQKRYVYNDAGLLVSEVELVDGRVEAQRTYLYDAAGALIREDDDFDNDGAFNLRTDYLYAAPGLCAGRVYTFTDARTSTLTFVTNSAGDVEFHTGTGSESTVYVTTNDFDERGHLVARDIQSLQVGAPNGRVDYTWDCPAQPESECIATWPTCDPSGLSVPLLPRCGA